jgi:hypothetical protein
VADFLTAFNQAYNTTDRVVQDFEISKIANAKPQESQGFTPEQGDQLRAAAESGQYDIGYDDAKGGYTVTPKADPAQTGVIAQQGVTDFMGQRTAGTMTDDQANSARQRAMAGVVMRSDPVRGTAMMRDITRDQRDTERYGWEKARNERQMRIDQDADADKALMSDVDAKVGEWFQSRLANPDGTQRQAGVDDHLAASQYRASQLMAAGKTDAAGQVMKEYNAQSLVKIQLESAQRNEALGKTAAALASGDLAAVREFYNQYIPDGARVTDVKQGPKGEIVIQRERLDGTPLPATTMKDTGQLLASLNTFKDPMALYNWSQNEFRNNLALKAENRAATQFAQGQSDRAQTKADAEARANAAVTLFKERNPSATQAELDAVRRGILEPVPTADKNAPSEVKLAKAMVDAGLAPDMRSGLEMAITKKSQSAKEAYLDLMKPQGGIAPREEDVAVVMETAFGAGWRDKVGGAGGNRPASGKAQDAPKVNSAAELAKLPKGARYTAPDGSIRIKQ